MIIIIIKGNGGAELTCGAETQKRNPLVYAETPHIVKMSSKREYKNIQAARERGTRKRRERGRAEQGCRDTSGVKHLPIMLESNGFICSTGV